MNRDQTRDALEACVRACYYGATRRSRLEWNLVMAGIATTQEAARFIRICLDARLLEDHHSYGWISANPFLIGILDNWEALTKDIPWTDDVTTQEESDNEAASTGNSQVL
jgi:hypothetical protein